MKFFLVLVLFFSFSCSQKNVYVCGNKECSNKKEVKKYFEENLTLTVKKTDNKKKNKNIDLVELNKSKKNNKKFTLFDINKIRLPKKESTSERLETTSDENMIQKNSIKKRISNILQSNNNISITNDKKTNVPTKKQKVNNSKIGNRDLDRTTAKLKPKNKSEQTINNNNKSYAKPICDIDQNCDIYQIEKTLTDKGKNKDYPNL